MVGLARHTLGGMDIRATRGMIGVGGMDTTHSGVGALVGVATLIIRDLSRHTTIITTIHLTMAVVTVTTVDLL
jgi:hypothetical protein